MVLVHMLTTTDNPYDPFDEYEQWYQFDAQKGYHSPSLLDRISVNSEELSDADQLLANEQAIDAIVSDNYSGVHTKVSREYKNVFEED